MEIQNYKTKTIYLNLATGEATFNLNVYFPVDEVVIKHCTFHNETPDGDELCLLQSSLTNDIILAFPKASAFFEILNTPYKLASSNINGDYTFRVISAVDGTQQTFTSLFLALTVMFVQYKK